MYVTLNVLLRHFKLLEKNYRFIPKVLSCRKCHLKLYMISIFLAKVMNLKKIYNKISVKKKFLPFEMLTNIHLGLDILDFDFH